MMHFDKVLFIYGVVLLAALSGTIVILAMYGTSDDRNARKCQTLYGTYTYHPARQGYCVLQDGSLKGLQP
jgi:hypothetical protein